MSGFKVGERVAVYEYVHEYGENHPGHAKRSIWEIRSFKGGLVFCAKENSLNLSWFHLKQLRRLKKRCCQNGYFNQKHTCAKQPPKPEPRKAREFWVLDTPSVYPTCYRSEPSWDGEKSPYTCHVREVREGEVTVSREDLAKAWEDNPLTQGEEIFFEMFIKSIGLETK